MKAVKAQARILQMQHEAQIQSEEILKEVNRHRFALAHAVRLDWTDSEHFVNFVAS